MEDKNKRFFKLINHTINEAKFTQSVPDKYDNLDYHVGNLQNATNQVNSTAQKYGFAQYNDVSKKNNKTLYYFNIEFFTYSLTSKSKDVSGNTITKKYDEPVVDSITKIIGNYNTEIRYDGSNTVVLFQSYQSDTNIYKPLFEITFIDKTLNDVEDLNRESSFRSKNVKIEGYKVKIRILTNSIVDKFGGNVKPITDFVLRINDRIKPVLSNNSISKIKNDDDDNSEQLKSSVYLGESLVDAIIYQINDNKLITIKHIKGIYNIRILSFNKSYKFIKASNLNSNEVIFDLELAKTIGNRNIEAMQLGKQLPSGQRIPISRGVFLNDKNEKIPLISKSSNDYYEIEFIEVKPTNIKNVKSDKDTDIGVE